MTQKKVFMVIFLSTISLLHLFSDVPPARLHQPDVPYFLESMSFRTVKMQIFPERYAGMFVDTYGDLFLNPAFILRQSKKSVYLDFNVQNQVPYFSPPFFHGPIAITIIIQITLSSPPGIR